MDSRIELQLDRTIIVLGPQVTKFLASSNKVPPLTFESLRNSFSDVTVERESSLLLQSRLQEVFAVADESSLLKSCSLAEHLLDLQRDGALLAYLYPDTIIDQTLNLKSLTSTRLDEWVEHDKCIMHLYGTYSDIDSMQWCIAAGEKPTPSSAVLNVFKEKLCVCVGFDETSQGDDQSDLQSFLTRLPSEETSYVLLPCEKVTKPARGLSVFVGNLCETLYPIGDTSKAIGGMIEHTTNELGKPISFLMASKTDYVKAAKLLSTLPGMNFQLLNSMEYSGLTFHILTVQTDSEKFQEFWCSLMQPSFLGLLVNYTVLAIILTKGTFIWLGGGGASARLTKVPLATANTQSLTLTEILTSNMSSIPTNGAVGSSLPSNLQHQSAGPLSFDIASVLKQNKTYPRYTVKKQKFDSSKSFNDHAISPSSSTFKRRMSLGSSSTGACATTNGPTLFPQQNTGKMKPAPNSRQHLLLTRYFANRKNDANQPLRAATTECKQLRQMLQEKPKEIPKPSAKAVKFLANWISTKQKNLFISDSRDWSSQVDRDLDKKIAKWRRIRERRLNKLRRTQEEEEIAAALQQQQQQQERLRRNSIESNASSISDIVRQFPARMPAGLINGPPIQSPLLAATVNPYILPQTANFPGLRTPMMYHQPSYLSSYPLLTTLPVQSFMLPNTSNLVLVSSGSLGQSLTPTVTMATSNSAKNLTIVPPSVPVPPVVPHGNAVSTSPSSSCSSPKSAKSKRKHSDQENASYSMISSLLTRKDHILAPPPTKSSRVVYSPASLSDGKSDEEESTTENMSCDSSESEDNQLPLWKFLLEMLLSNSYPDLIGWNRIHSLEFQLKQPREVAKLWSSYKSDSSMDYGRFQKALQFYCSKDQPILSEISAKDKLYCFSSSMLYYINNRYSQLQKSELMALNSSSSLEKAQELCGSQEVLVVD